MSRNTKTLKKKLKRMMKRAPEVLRGYAPVFVAGALLLAFGIWSAVELMSSEYELCGRYDSAHYCAPICEQGFLVEEVDHDHRRWACGNAADDYVKRSEFAKAVHMLEVCQGFGGCREEQLADCRCFENVDACSERCASGAARDCAALLEFFTLEDHRDLERARELVSHACALDPEKCDRYASRVCKYALEACSEWCRAGTTSSAAQLCFSASEGFTREADKWARFSFDEEDSEADRVSNRKSIARYRQRAASLMAMGCQLAPLEHDECSNAMCAVYPKACADMCQNENRAAFCLGLGEAYADGSTSLPKSDAQSLAFRVRACELDVSIDPGCARVLCEKDLRACRYRCDAHSAGHCYSLGTLRAETDADEGNALRLKACRLDEKVAEDCSVYLNAPTLR